MQNDPWPSAGAVVYTGVVGDRFKFLSENAYFDPAEGRTHLSAQENEAAGGEDELHMQLYVLSWRDRVDEALDLLFDAIDQKLSAGEFAACDQWLAQVNIARLSPPILMGLLMATAPAREHLPARRSLHERIRTLLVDRKKRHDLEAVLRSLE